MIDNWPSEPAAQATGSSSSLKPQVADPRWRASSLHTDYLDAVNNPEDPVAGTRKVPFSRELYIEQDDFREVPPPKYFRLTPGREVRLRYGYLITCTSVVKNDNGEVVAVRHFQLQDHDRDDDGDDAVAERFKSSFFHAVFYASAGRKT